MITTNVPDGTGNAKFCITKNSKLLMTITRIYIQRDDSLKTVLIRGDGDERALELKD